MVLDKLRLDIFWPLTGVGENHKRQFYDNPP